MLLQVWFSMFEISGKKTNFLDICCWHEIETNPIIYFKLHFIQTMYFMTLAQKHSVTSRSFNDNLHALMICSKYWWVGVTHMLKGFVPFLNKVFAHKHESLLTMNDWYTCRCNITTCRSFISREWRNNKLKIAEQGFPLHHRFYTVLVNENLWTCILCGTKNTQTA